MMITLNRRTLLAALAASCAAPMSTLGAETLPTYRTQMPIATQLSYQLRRGRWRGRGELRWQPTSTGYQIKLEGRVAGLRILSWLSEGQLDEATGIAPQRFTDQRYGKGPKVATFNQRSALISYTDASETFPWMPGTQDRLSWMIQVAAIANANPKQILKGQHIKCWVSGARADASIWSFESQGPDTVAVASGSIPAIKLLREPRKEGDTRVEVWLDPAQEHLPVRARLANADDQDALELTWIATSK
jgi:Protein of unknown function (DUF3108)